MFVVVWIVALGVISWLISWVSTYFGAVFDPDYFSPLALSYLDGDSWTALALTTLATIAGFIVCLGIGYFLGVVASIMALSKLRALRLAGLAINVGFDAAYVVPIVVTLGLVLALLFDYAIENRIYWIVPVGAVIAATTVLGGYQIFKAIYTASTLPADRNRTLVDALFSRPDRVRFSWFRDVLTRLVKVHRLRDAAITDYTEAIRRAFHLSLVAVVIVEAIRPQIYENIFPQTFAPPPSLGGVGWIILSQQNGGNPDVIVGLIWALFLLDLIIVSVIDAILFGLFTRHSTTR